MNRRGFFGLLASAVAAISARISPAEVHAVEVESEASKDWSGLETMKRRFVVEAETNLEAMLNEQLPRMGQIIPEIGMVVMYSRSAEKLPNSRNQWIVTVEYESLRKHL